jgi:hypothetical protein
VVHIYPLLGNGPINTHSRQPMTVISVGSVPSSYLEDNRRYKQFGVLTSGQRKLRNPFLSDSLPGTSSNNTTDE